MNRRKPGNGYRGTGAEISNKKMKEYSETIPIQYAEGKTRFMGMDVLVDERVLIPRPETELLVSVVADLCRQRSWSNIEIMDVGTGSGIVSLGIKKLIFESKVTAIDISENAINVALNNVEVLGFDGIRFIKSDMFSGLGKEHLCRYNCIVSNPPYVSAHDYDKLDAWVKAEPKIALYGGQYGMDYINILAERSLEFIVRGGFLAIEIGYDQTAKTKEKLEECGFVGVKSFKDFNEYERVVVGWKNG